jgi:hypothetical protein
MPRLSALSPIKSVLATRAKVIAALCFFNERHPKEALTHALLT